MAEDRGIEPFEQLLKLCERTEIYAHFVRVLCRKADDKYNSGLFHFEREPGVAEAPDRLTPCLKIDDKAIKPILQSLYFEYGSPYQFGVMPVEILGTVYERFLGKVIRLTEGHQAKIEEKPEVRKAGGVYYTPAYIVDYIVKNTVGKKIEDKSPAQLAGGKNGPPLRVLDMACGSGSFLLGAYQRLLDHCLTWYQGHKPESHKKAVYQDSRKGDWRLTIEEKKRILTTHVFGVDIDPQAVEVTKLSLLLKVLEGETDQTFGDQMKLFQTRALPNLSNNIKCGNSLIGPDYFSGRLIPDPEELKRVNPFDWNAGFPEAMKAGGFDCVIGNPPYVRQEILGPRFKEYAQNAYASYAGTADLYTYFIEKSHLLLKKGGSFGMICSNKFMRANYGNALRSFISKHTTIEQIIDFGELPVFEGAATFPAIFLTTNLEPDRQKFIYAPIKRLDFQSLEKEVKEIGIALDERSLAGDNWTLAKAEEIEVFEKIKKMGIPLGDYVKGKIYRGILTGLNEAFVIDKATRDRLIREDKKSAELIKPFVVGDDIRKYRINFKNRYLIFTRRGTKITDYPAIEKYLLQFKDRLMPKPKGWKGKEWNGRKPGSYKWYEIQDTVEYFKELDKTKIIWPEIAKESRFSIDNECLYLNKTCFFSPNTDIYLLGVLNSKLIWYYLKKICSVLGDAEKGGRLLQQKIYLETVPIIEKEKMDSSQQKIIEEIKSSVRSIISINKHLLELKSDTQKSILQRQIEATDREIDQLVYELYGLTEEEIKIVEGETK
ncbi:MAG TPA: TaqI-like C-terminal specificity domain-containing protein [Candidatus Aminicenantes bacterium]|nr:TaqI-like C-terminal specificity domain-containing protein [Candidatus Aminicenantes bacterium]